MNHILTYFCCFLKVCCFWLPTHWRIPPGPGRRVASFPAAKANATWRSPRAPNCHGPPSDHGEFFSVLAKNKTKTCTVIVFFLGQCDMFLLVLIYPNMIIFLRAKPWEDVSSLQVLHFKSRCWTSRLAVQLSAGWRTCWIGWCVVGFDLFVLFWGLYSRDLKGFQAIVLKSYHLSFLQKPTFPSWVDPVPINFLKNPWICLRSLEKYENKIYNPQLVFQ